MCVCVCAGEGRGGELRADSFETKWIFKVCFVSVSANKGEFNYETNQRCLFVTPSSLCTRWESGGRSRVGEAKWGATVSRLNAKRGVNILKSPQILGGGSLRLTDALIGRRVSSEASGCLKWRNGAAQVERHPLQNPVKSVLVIPDLS